MLQNSVRGRLAALWGDPDVRLAAEVVAPVATRHQHEATITMLMASHRNMPVRPVLASDGQQHEARVEQARQGERSTDSRHEGSRPR